MKIMSQEWFHYSQGMMSMFFRAVKNPRGAIVTLASEKKGGGKVAKSGRFMLIKDGLHRGRAIEMLKEQGSFPWTKEWFRVLHLMHRSCLSIQHAEEITLCKVANTSTSIVPRDKWLLDTMKELLNYAGASQLEYGLKIFHTRTIDAFDYLQSSD